MFNKYIFALFLLLASTNVFSQGPAYTTVYVTKTGEKYHVAGCRSLAKSSIPMSLADAVKRYTPCAVCKPPTLSSSTTAPVVTAPAVSTVQASFSGKVVAVTDGDTIKVLRDGKETTIRLNGIDAPESNQSFGQRAKQLCSELCFGIVVTVRVMDTDRYGRLVADIVLADGSILNRELVRLGMAWHYKQYSKDAVLAELELKARASKIGLWADSNPVPPWEFRK